MSVSNFDIPVSNVDTPVSNFDTTPVSNCTPPAACIKLRYTASCCCCVKRLILCIHLTGIMWMTSSYQTLIHLYHNISNFDTTWPARKIPLSTTTACGLPYPDLTLEEDLASHTIFEDSDPGYGTKNEERRYFGVLSWPIGIKVDVLRNFAAVTWRERSERRERERDRVTGKWEQCRARCRGHNRSTR